jgi:hypothetical protein
LNTSFDRPHKTMSSGQNKIHVCRVDKARWISLAVQFLLPLAAIFAAPAFQSNEIPPHEEMPRKESKFTFARFNYAVPNIAYWGPLGDQGPPWSHDWPESEEHFMKIMSEVTKLDVNPGGHIISFENDECFKYPIAYFCEVGFMNLSDHEVQNMREYLLRGGFLIVDDFRGERALQNFRYQMSRVFPDRALEEVPRTDPIWTCFYDISKLIITPPYNRFMQPQYFGIRDDKGRLMMMVNYNNDISDYWQWSNDPRMPIDETNEAYKYGVNFVMYALSH